MALKILLLLLASYLLVTKRVSANDEEFGVQATYAKAPVPAPVKTPIPAPPVKPPTVTPNPPAPVVKPPTVVPKPPAPPVSPPTVAPKPPAPVPPTVVPKPPSPPVNPPTPKPPASPVKPPTVAPKPPVPPVTPPTTAPMPPVRTRLDCVPLCDQRCKAHSRKNICVRACMTCCDRCKCVPPGTYGNREKCGKCYTDMTTHGNKPKCP
ncbi:Gibberellin-regulated protein 14 [Vitis vinifera]|uniref:Gibberellin-regulated protein 14 n=1 Tax=Vitis vinifera TaxID=29760 RepID=A0A438EFW0_VITVI|nr:Gibberellin-regulated protein 14 [Vitis vinifera]